MVPKMNPVRTKLNQFHLNVKLLALDSLPDLIYLVILS